MNVDPKKILSEAKGALEKKKVRFDPRSSDIVDEFMKLNIGDSKEIWTILGKLLMEIEPHHHVGTEHNESTFSFPSKHLGRKMVLKFSLSNGFFLYRSLRAQ